MIDAFIALGSNLGDRLANIAKGLEAVDAVPETHVAAVSHAYETEPWGVADQPPYLNAVARIGTRLEAPQLLALLKEAEADLGREPGPRFGPRTIDLDILLFGDEEWSRDDLVIPHPRMAEREFVVRPLLEIAPDARYPDGTPVTAELATQGRILSDEGPVPGWEALTPVRAEAHEGTPEQARADLGPEDIRSMHATPDYRVPGREERFRTPSGEEWVALGVARLDPSPAMPELLFFEAVLKDAGIPCEFYPARPGESFYSPYGVPRFVDLYVPAGRLAEARELVREASAASPDEG